MKKWQEMSRFFYKILKNFIAVRPGSAGERGLLENPSGALHPFRPAVAGLWECARVLASLFLLLNPCQYLDSEVVWHLDPIGLERIDRSHKRRSRVGFKPAVVAGVSPAAIQIVCSRHGCLYRKRENQEEPIHLSQGLARVIREFPL